MNAPADRNSHLRTAMEQIALDSIGTLSVADGTSWVRAHLADGCPICLKAKGRVTGVFDDLLFAARPVEPPSVLRDRVLQAVRKSPLGGEAEEPVESGASAASSGTEEIQIWNRWASTESKFYTLPSSEGEWEDTAVEGVQARLLHVDQARDEVTMLIRMAPGTAYPSHRHAGDEQCFVLQGDLEVEDKVLHAGDYQFAPEGSIHGVQSTERGCTLLIVSSRHDEILAG